MMFSTKAEYGVRLMIHLARHDAEGPVSLASIAEAEELPLAYLEHLAARLRRAELITSTRGARGGYALARAPGTVTMAEVVRALEGEIAPIECITADSDGRPVCARDGEPGHDPCPTKLLWTRVQGSIVRTLDEVTLQELVKQVAHKSGRAAAGGPSSEAGRRASTSRRGAGGPAELIPTEAE